MTEKVELYRLRHAWSNGASSGSETEYFEQRDRLYNRLLHLLIQIESDPNSNSRNRGRKAGDPMPWLTWEWWARRAEVKEERRRPTRVIAIQQLVDGAWEDLTYTLTAPELVWGDDRARAEQLVTLNPDVWSEMVEVVQQMGYLAPDEPTETLARHLQGGLRRLRADRQPKPDAPKRGILSGEFYIA